MRKRKLKLDYNRIADALGASKRIKIDSQGLEVVLNIKLDKKPHRVGYFPLECLDGYDLDNQMVVVSSDYRVWKSLSSATLFFKSSAPNRPMIFVPESKIVSIKSLSNNKILYQK